MTSGTVLAPVRDHRRLILGVCALLVLAGIVYTARLSHRLDDFQVYARAATRALHGEPLYRPEDGHWLFKYLPAFAVAAIPIALVPVQIAKPIWFLATTAMLVPLLAMTLAALPERRKAGWMLVVATIVVMGDLYAHELKLGQTNIFLVTAIVAALLSMKHGREGRAGALVVLAVVLKPYAVLLLPWLVARRKWVAVATAACGMVLVLLLPAFRYGWEPAVGLHLEWWRTVTTSVEPNLLNIDNVSWLAMYSRWFGAGITAQVFTALTLLAAVAVVIVVFQRRHASPFPELLEASLLLTLMPLMSPQGWEYTLLTATPAVMCLVNYSDALPVMWRRVTLVALGVIGLSVYDLMGRTLHTAFMRASGVTLAFFVVITSLVLLRQRQSV